MGSTQQSTSRARVGDLPAKQRRVIRAWCMFDWANSAFATSGTTAIFPVYFVFLFKEALGESATVLGIAFTASSTWSLAVAISTAFVAISSPALGVIADRVPIKKTLLWIYTVTGSLFTVLAFFSAYTGNPWAWMIGMFTLANVGFAGSLVFYNSFLPHIGPRHLLDDISSRGFAYGYVGGGLLLLGHLILILTTQDSDIADLVTRASIASIGIWWFGWALWTLIVVPEPPIQRPNAQRLGVATAFSMAFVELGRTLRSFSLFRVALIYLAAYLLFNDGVQTVLAISGAFGADTLGLPLAFNMATILIIQFVAAPSAIAFGRLAGWISTKRALIVSLVGWIFIVLFGVALVPLVPKDHADFDYRLSYRPDLEVYVVDHAPDSDDKALTWAGETWSLQGGDELSPRTLRGLPDAVRSSNDFRYSVSIEGGDLDGQTAVGPRHPSQLGLGRLDWWPSAVRSVLWQPLGIGIGYQWLLLGLLVGLIIGGSQALARSLFAQIIPESRSGEFFSFFGFMSRASSVFGPIMYVVATSVFDTRVAIASILLIIVVGTIMLKWVDVREGTRVALEEEARILRGNPKTE